MLLSEITAKLRRHTIGIAGCGGLGSNCAVALARIGIGRLVVADFDVVTEGNLNRQYYFRDQIGRKKVDALAENIARINPEVVVERHDIRLGRFNIPDLFRDCDVIVEAFDLADQKEMLIETAFGAFPEKPLVLGLGMAGWGMNATIIEQRSDNLYICGDGQTEIGEHMPPLAPRVGIVANMQANVVVEILLSDLT